MGKAKKLRKQKRGLDKQTFRHKMLGKTTKKPAEGEHTLKYWKKEEDEYAGQSSRKHLKLRKKRKK